MPCSVTVMCSEELMLPTLKIRVHKAQYWALSVLQDIYQNYDTWSSANKRAPETQKQTGLLNFGGSKMTVFYFKSDGNPECI